MEGLWFPSGIHQSPKARRGNTVRLVESSNLGISWICWWADLLWVDAVDATDGTRGLSERFGAHDH